MNDEFGLPASPRRHVSASGKHPRVSPERVVFALYLTSLALLPWAWFPPFPWLHEHAQWSDAVFALAAALWSIERWRNKDWPRLGPMYAAMAFYLGAATLSLIFSSPDKQAGMMKLLGLVELCALAVITSDLASRNGFRTIVRVVAATSLAVAIAAIAGLILFYADVDTKLIGIYGELVPSRWYARAQAGFYNPNLLASYCIFAAAVVARGNDDLPPALRRIVEASLWVAVGLTFSRAIIGFVLAAAIRLARTRSQRILVGIFAAACASVIISLTLWKPALDPLNPFSIRFDTSAPTSRGQAILTSLDTLAANPLFGSGVGAHPGLYRGAPFDAHFTPLNIAATMGLPALVAFASLPAILWRRRPRPTDIAIWSGFAGLALDALAADIEDFRHLWVLIGLAGAGSIGGSAPASEKAES